MKRADILKFKMKRIRLLNRLEFSHEFKSAIYHRVFIAFNDNEIQKNEINHLKRELMT